MSQYQNRCRSNFLLDPRKGLT